MGKYALVNPMVIGKLNTIVEAENSSVAAKELYNTISPFFSKAQSKFVFTIQKLGGSKKEHQLGGSNAQYHDFKVREVLKGGGDEVVFTISTYSGKVNHAHLTNSIKNVLSKISKDANLSDSEDEGEAPKLKSKKSKKSMKGGKDKKSNYDDGSDSFDKVLEELDEEEDNIFPKKKNSSLVTSALYPYGPGTVYPYSYFPSFYIPTLVDPISYYWYNDIYLNTSRLYMPSFISSISPRVIVDRSYIIESSRSTSSKDKDNTLSLSIDLD